MPMRWQETTVPCMRTAECVQGAIRIEMETQPHVPDEETHGPI